MLSLADARFLSTRALSLARRSWVSLRTRGWRPTWQRIATQLQWAPVVRVPVWLPPDADGIPAAVPHAETPRVSIVIPVYNQVDATLLCLRALAEHPPAVHCEVIVVDDCSTDATATLLPRIAGLRYERRSENGGFIEACNTGASVARGDILVFLNNDTIPQPGWLDALVATFDALPGTGIAGARLLYRNGRLQEAGGFLTSDAHAESYGRFDSADDPRYGYVRDAHYVSGAALAIPGNLFREVGGFNRRFAPAYYEDTDLAFAVREAGRRVVYQPAARVVHDEGTTSGTDPERGVKAHQARNRVVLAQHRRETLQAFPAPGTLPSPAVLHRHQQQILVIDALTPQPDHDSGSVRLVNLMRLLREEGAHVVFLPANRMHAGAYTEALQQLGVEVWYAPFAARAPAWLREHGPRFDTVLVCRHYVASEFLPLLRRHARQARILFDSVDLHYLREQRAAELSADAALMRAARRTRKAELAVIGAADATLVVSEVERALLANDAPGSTVEVLSNLHRVAGVGAPFAQREDLVFVGGFRHPPNVDAVRWFVESVWPRVRAELGNVRFHCIGSDVPAEIRALDQRDGVVVHGHVADIAPYMDGCRIAVAPLRFGAGVKGKINLSMAHGQPVVATSCAVEGMHLADGNDVLVADDPDAFAAHIVSLYRDGMLWERLSLAGLENVRLHFSIDAARPTVRRLFLR